MALDFPANPTNGQTFGQYIYDTTIPGWRNVNSSEGIGLQFKSGLIPVVPTSVTVNSGSATVSSNGLVTFTNASQFYINGIYTSAYDRYLVVMTINSQASANYVYTRHTTGGTWYSGAQSWYGVFYRQAASWGNLGYGEGVAHSTIGYAQSGLQSDFKLDIANPYRNDAQTTLQVQSTYGNYSHTSVYGSSLLAANDRFDGITVYNGSTANMSGTIRAYGYN